MLEPMMTVETKEMLAATSTTKILHWLCRAKSTGQKSRQSGDLADPTKHY
jgi:hypothetical protein